MTPDFYMVQVRELLAVADTAGVTLPAEVTGAVKVHAAVADLLPPSLQPFEVGEAATEVVAAVRADVDPHLGELAARLRASDVARRDHELGTRVLAAAREEAAVAGLQVVRSHADAIVTGSLRPVHEQVLEAARAAAEALAGVDLGSTPALILAAAPARKAFAVLSELVPRRLALFQARRLVYGIAQRKPQLDTADMFTELRDPFAPYPDLRPGAPLPGKRLPGPTDPLERLRWVVTDGAACKPWMPTLAEQDEQWWARYGEAVQRQTSAQRTWGHVRVG